MAASSANARAARERKQKIFVAVGGLFLLAMLAFQLPKLMGGSSSAAATTETTAVDGAATPTADTAVPVSVALRDTDRRLPVGPGKLRSFTVFERKNPFVQQVSSDEAPADGSESAGGGGVAPSDEKPEQTPSKGFTVGGTENAAAVTVISVNGVRQALEAGSAFPVADPVFVLVAEQPGKKTVTIGVAGGEYASGDRTTKLKVGKPLVLVNTATGARYRVVLVAVGNGAATGESSPTTPAPSSPNER